jgi:hypothetical protein
MPFHPSIWARLSYGRTANAFYFRSVRKIIRGKNMENKLYSGAMAINGELVYIDDFIQILLTLSEQLEMRSSTSVRARITASMTSHRYMQPNRLRLFIDQF